jgi:type IV secretion system protein VirB6
MNDSSSVISNILSQVDYFGAHFVANSYVSLVAEFSPVIYSLTTVYLGFVFLSIKRGTLAIQDLPFVLLRMTCILTLALNYEYFCLFIYDVFTVAPLVVCHAITAHGSSISSAPISDALDQFLRQGMSEANKLFAMGSWTNITYTVFGLCLFFATIISSALAVGLIMVSKIGSVVLLSLSPIFIFFAMFNATKSFFDSWISQLVTYSLIPIMTCVVLMIVLSVTESTLSHVSHVAHPSLKAIVPFLLSCISQIWLLPQIKSKCAALASGFTLQGVVSTLEGVKNNFKSATSMATGGKTGRATVAASAGFISQGIGKLKRYSGTGE